MILQLDKREDDDPFPYLLVVWKPGIKTVSLHQPFNPNNSRPEYQTINDDQNMIFSLK